MKIERVFIESFGHFRRTELELGPGLNCIYGENGAGKSTLLGFIRAVLFGFERKKDHPQRYEPEDGAMGGELKLATPQGGLWVRRGKSQRLEGELTVRGPGGEPVASSRLSDALHGVSRELFYEVFAFGLTELSDFDKLSEQGTVSEALFAAGTQGAQRLPLARDTLERSLSDLYTPRGNKRLNQALHRLAELRAQSAAVGNRPEQYGSKTERLEAVALELARVEVEEGRALEELNRLRALNDALPDLARFRELEVEQRGLRADFDAFPLEAVARFLEARHRAYQATTELQKVAAAEASIESQRAGLEAAWDTRACEAALAVWNGRTELRRGLLARRAAALARERQVQAALRELGLEVGGGWLLGLDLGAEARAQLQQIREELNSAESAEAQSLAAAEALSPELERLEIRLQDCEVALGGPPALEQDELARVERALGEANAIQEAQQRLTEKLASVSAERGGVGFALEGPPAPLISRRDAGVVLGVLVLAAGCALAVLQGNALRAAALCLALVTALVVWAYSKVTRAHRRAVAEHASRIALSAAANRETQARLGNLEAEWQLLGAALVQALRGAGLPGTAKRDDVGRRGAELAVLRAQTMERDRQRALRIELNRDLKTLSERQGRCFEVARAAAQRGEGARGKRGLWCRERSLPEGLGTEALSELVTELQTLRERLHDLHAETLAREGDIATCAVGDGQVLAAGQGLGVVFADAEAGAVELAARVRRAHEEKARSERLLGDGRELAVQRATLERTVADAKRVCGQLLSSARCADEDELRRAEAEVSRARNHTQELRDVRHRLSALLRGDVNGALARLEALGGEGALGNLITELERAAQTLKTARLAAMDERAALRHQVELWERDRELSEIRMEEEAVAASAVTLARRYAVDVLARELLVRARERYETHRQPEVIRRASSFFHRLTRGAYARVFAVAGEAGALKVHDVTGASFPAEKLSRGTREQLFLAFRLALVEELSATRGPLPLILDDVLVNFDAERIRATLAVLKELSQRHQILALTCHPAMRDAFAEAGAKVHALTGRGPQPILQLA